MMLESITPLILTLDEEANIGRVLDRLAWAREVVVVDSGSRDATHRILAEHANVRCIEHPFTSHAEQWNFGLAETGIMTEWVLALDADYVLSDGFVDELEALSPDNPAAGFAARFDYAVFGRTLRASAYPPVTVLYRRSGAHYVQDGHTQRVAVNGRVEFLGSRILHDDRKPLARWLAAQDRYARLESEHLATSRWGDLGWVDRLRSFVVFMPALAFVHCLVIRGGILDGWAGVHYATQRALAEAILALALIERRLGTAEATAGRK